MKTETASTRSTDLADWVKQYGLLLVIAAMSHAMAVGPSHGTGAMERVQPYMAPLVAEYGPYHQPQPRRLGLTIVPPMRRLIRAIAA